VRHVDHAVGHDAGSNDRIDSGAVDDGALQQWHYRGVTGLRRRRRLIATAGPAGPAEDDTGDDGYLHSMDSVAAFGRWPSPLSAAQAAAGKVSLSDVSSDGDSLYWLESRPAEGGRVVCVRSDAAGIRDISPEGVSIRSRVHEYGGGGYCLVTGVAPGAFAYVDVVEQRVWLCAGEGMAPVALTGAPPPGERWAHGGLGASADGAWVVAVREMHDRDDGRRPRRCIVALGSGPDNSGESILAEGHDFYGAPRLDAAARRLATVVWDHPDMPWDRSAVVVTPLVVRADGPHGAARLVAAGEGWTIEAGEEISVGQPAWQRDGSLRYVSDRLGWWQPYVHPADGSSASAQPLTITQAEFHGPDWNLGQSTMVELSDGTVVARMTSAGLDTLVLIGSGDQPPPPHRTVPQPCVGISGLCRHRDGVALVGATPDAATTIWTLEPLDPLPTATPRRPPPASLLRASDIARGEAFSFPSRSGRTVHGLLYRPTLGHTAGPEGALPPLVVQCHPGPTGAVGAGFDVVAQYFTSRGFALAAVDYAGSTGYGRAYRRSLWGQWGVLDAEDCVDAARHLAQNGTVDGNRMAARGASSGGLTALNALADATTFAAAVSWYGVTDLLALAASTHDFEACYLDRLVGLLPEHRETYEARSPAAHPGALNGAVLLLQGLNDPIVPPAQTERMRDALVAEGRHCTTRFFEGEGHGFRRAETLQACLEEELAFYQRELLL
jgi:dipeptidyl aminopeptidase/acylaminoacyl peptidase